jgi:hypothetical protein
MVFSIATPAFSAGDPTLTEQETANLLYMYEEEKLARDVYTAMYPLWEQQIFQKIATSEQKHMDAIQVLLERYGVLVPQNPPGEFTDPDFTDLYTGLIATGSWTLLDALNVGVSIEEKEISDLGIFIGNTTRKDIKKVYNHLLSASIKHLSSFNKVLSKLDVEGDELTVLGAALLDGNGKGNGYQLTYALAGQSQNQTQAQTQTQNQYQDQNQTQTQNQYQDQIQNQYQDQIQNQYQYQDQTQDQDQNQTQTQAQTGNGEGSGDCTCDCGCTGPCDGSGSQNGKP